MPASISKRIKTDKDVKNALAPQAGPVNDDWRDVTLAPDETRILIIENTSGFPDYIRLALAANSHLVLERANCVLEVETRGPHDAVCTIRVNDNSNVVLVKGVQGEMPLQLEIGTGSCVELDGPMFLASSSAPVRVAFRSNGSGCLSAVWSNSAFAVPEVEVSGMAAGDQLNLSCMDDVGILHMITSLDEVAAVPLAPYQSLPQTTAVPPIPVRVAASGHLAGMSWCADSPPPPRFEGVWSDTPLAESHQQVVFCGRIPHHLRAELGPVQLAANALASGVPSAPLALAPWQLLDYHGIAVYAHQMLNGKTVTQNPHWHWLRYDVPPGLVKNSHQTKGLLLRPGRGHWIRTGRRETEICRQRMLNYTAEALALELVSQPALRLDFNGQVIPGTSSLDGRRWRFQLPPTLEPCPCRILSRSAVPKETSILDQEDQRTLGVALQSVDVLANGERRRLDINHPDWRGLHALSTLRGSTLRWTNGMAALPHSAHGLRGGEILEIDVGATVHYWRLSKDKPTSDKP